MKTGPKNSGEVMCSCSSAGDMITVCVWEDSIGCIRVYIHLYIHLCLYSSWEFIGCLNVAARKTLLHFNLRALCKAHGIKLNTLLCVCVCLCGSLRYVFVICVSVHCLVVCLKYCRSVCWGMWRVYRCSVQARMSYTVVVLFVVQFYPMCTYE